MPDSRLPSSDPPPAHPESLCQACAARRAVRTKSALFVLCTALPVKYPRQPVATCPQFRPRTGE
jgi:hypothetical protein